MKHANHPVVGAINLRLKQAREHEGLSLTDWHRRVDTADFSIGYTTVRKYEDHLDSGQDRARVPPADYVAKVSQIFGIRLQWLLLGHEPMKTGGMEEDEAKDRDFEKALYGEPATAALTAVPWLRDPAPRIAFLRLLLECQKASGERQLEIDTLPDLVAAFFAFPFQLPGDVGWIADPADLTPREKSMVAMHLSALMNMLFVPFREADVAFKWSKVVQGRAPSTNSTDKGGSDAT